jgi:tetratricopeptide (TPR) repeat protein
LGKDDEAYDAFYKSVWNSAWMDSGYYQLACIASKKGNWDEALDLIDRSLIRNWRNHKARQLKVSILRKLGKTDEAEILIQESLALDKFNFGVLFEKLLFTAGEKSSPGYLAQMTDLLRANIHTYIEFALDFSFAGLHKEAIAIINLGIKEQKGKPVYPMALYFNAWFEAQNGNHHASECMLEAAAHACPDYCFPNQNEAVVVLKWALTNNPNDSKAAYYLGNYWYNARQYNDAIASWELSARLNNHFPTVHRNLALAYFNKLNEKGKARIELEKAFELDENDSRIFMELDQLYKRMGVSAEVRMQKLEKYPVLLAERDDLYLEHVTLLNQSGQFESALNLLMTRKFHPWEGGEGKVTGQYVLCLTEMAKKAINSKEYEKAIDLLDQAQHYPENLGEGKLYGAQENAIFYWLGCAYDGQNMSNVASEYWNLASSGLKEPSPAIFYNDQQPDTIFYQGLALLRLGKTAEAKARFETLISFGKQHSNDDYKLDYFSVSMPDMQIWEDDLSNRNNQNYLFLIELGEQGMKKLNDHALMQGD